MLSIGAVIGAGIFSTLGTAAAGEVLPTGEVVRLGAGPEVRAFIENMHALKRLATPEEIAHAAAHLASDASSFITGTALLVDGGVSICRT